MLSKTDWEDRYNEGPLDWYGHEMEAQDWHSRFQEVLDNERCGECGEYHRKCKCEEVIDNATDNENRTMEGAGGHGPRLDDN